ncbi:hypothetical protein CIB48_g6658 [Xylaria polymorpha]|nr:hypothetical protein CIB48_g6658 [Xylaria polymorpha]
MSNYGGTLGLVIHGKGSVSRMMPTTAMMRLRAYLLTTMKPLMTVENNNEDNNKDADEEGIGADDENEFEI